MADNKTSIIISAVDQTEGALKNINSNLGQLEGQFNRLSGVVSGFAAVAGVTAFTGLVKGAIDTADKLYDVSQQTGASVEALSAMSGAAKLAGVDMQTVAGGLTKLSKNMLDAANGSGDAAKVFTALGISVKDTNGNLKSSDAVMMEFAKGLQTVSSGSERAAAAQMVFGKSGAQLVPLLADLAQKGTLQAKITTEQARAANELNDTLEILGRKSTAWATIVAADVVPSMQAFANVLLEVKTSADGTKDAVNGLSKNGSISSWANDAAVILAHVVDELRLIGKIAIEIATPIERVGKNLYNVGALAGIAFSGGSLAEKKAAYDQLKKESEAYYADLDQRLANNRADSPLFADRVKEQIAELEKLKKETEGIRKLYLDAGYSIEIANAAADRFRKASTGDGWNYKEKSLVGVLGSVGNEAEKAAKALENLRIDQMKLITKQADAEIGEIDKKYGEFLRTVESLVGPLESQAAALEKSVEFYGMTDEAIQRTIISRLEEQKILAESTGNERQVYALEREIEARKRIASAASQKDFLDANKKAAESAAREWEKFADDINRSLTDALFRAFESGGSFAENFAKTLTNTIKTALAKALIQAAVTTGSNALNGLINVVAGKPSSGTGSTNYLGLASNASSIYNLARGGYTAMVGNGISYAGNLAGSAYWSAYGAGVAAGTESTSAAAAIYYQSMVDAAVAGNAELAASYAATYNGLTAGGSAAGSASGMAGAATGVLAILAGMYMSGEAWQAGYKENGRWTDPSKPQTYELALRDIEFEINKSLFGKDFAESKLLAVLTGSSLQKQMTEAVQGWIFGKERMLGSGIKGTFSDTGFSDGQLGINMKKSGGWFSSSKEWTDWQALPEGVDKVLQSLYFTTKESFLKIANVVSDSSFVEKLKSFVYDYKTAAKAGESTTVDFGQLIAEASVSLAETMGKYLLPSIEGLRQTTEVNGQQITETWGQALARVSQETSAVSGVLDAMGKSLSDAFGANNANNVLAMSDAMVKLFGSIDGLTSAFNAYYENFYTSSEKTARGWEAMQAQFDVIGKTMPTTVEGFRALVDSLDLNTVAGQQTFANLMNIQGAFKQLADYLAQDMANAIKAITGLFDGLLSRISGVRSEVISDRESINNRGVMSAMQIDAEIKSAFPVLPSSSAIVSATQSLQQAISEKSSAASISAAENAAIRAQEDYARAIRQYVADAGRAVDKLNSLRVETVKYYEAQQQLANVLLTSAANLREAVKQARQSQLSEAELLAQKRNEFAQSYSLALSTTGTLQASYADKMAAALPSIVNLLQNQAASQVDLARATGQLFSQSNTIAGQLESTAGVDYQSESLALLNAIDLTLASIEANASSAEKIISDAVYETGKTTADGLRAVIAAINGDPIPTFATGGSFGGGWRIVGENGPELEATGPSRIFTASQTRSILAGAGGMDAIVEELRALRAENADLRAEVRAVATHTYESAKNLKVLQGDGIIVRTEAGAPLETTSA